MPEGRSLAYAPAQNVMGLTSQDTSGPAPASVLPPVLVRRRLERRPVVLAAAGVLFVVIFAVLQTHVGAADAIELFYVMPIALIALELGLRAGIAAASLSFALFLVWVASGDPGITSLGYFTRPVAFVAVGIIAGRFSDRMRATQRRQEQLLQSGLALAQVSDLDALPPLLAEHARRVVDLAGVHVSLDGDANAEAGPLHGDSLHVPIDAHGMSFGALEVAARPGRELGREDRVALSILALQAAAAIDHRRFLIAEHQRRLLGTALGKARGRVARGQRQLERVLDGQERERRQVAWELHEESAQALAAVLMGLAALEVCLESDVARAQLETVRGQVKETLVGLRSLAVSLRPPVLDKLGLVPALQRLAERASEDGARIVTVEAGDLCGRLTPEIETCAYRVAEEALGGIAGPAVIRLGLEPDGHLSLVVTEQGPGDAGHIPDLADFAASGARLELIRGALLFDRAHLPATSLVALLPLSRRKPALSGSVPATESSTESDARVGIR
jgi:signal transduction histidine kinase